MAKKVQIKNKTPQKHAIAKPRMGLKKRIPSGETIEFEMKNKRFNKIIPELIQMENQAFGSEKAFEIDVEEA